MALLQHFLPRRYRHSHLGQVRQPRVEAAVPRVDDREGHEGVPHCRQAQQEQQAAGPGDDREAEKTEGGDKREEDRVLEDSRDGMEAHSGEGAGGKVVNVSSPPL